MLRLANFMPSYEYYFVLVRIIWKDGTMSNMLAVYMNSFSADFLASEILLEFEKPSN